MADFKQFQKLRWFYQIFIVAGICGALLELVWWQFLTPVNELIAARDREIKKLQGEVTKARLQQQVFTRFKKEVAELESKLNTLKTILPLQKETDDLLRSVQDAVTTSGMRLLSFKPRAQSDKEVYLEWPIDMEIIGTYHSVGQYLDRIRQLPRIVNISNVRITSRAGSGGAAATESIAATYVATTFVYKEEQIASTGPAATRVK